MMMLKDVYLARGRRCSRRSGWSSEVSHYMTRQILRTCRIFPAKVTKVEHGAKPRIIVALQFEIFLESHDTADRRLITRAASQPFAYTPCIRQSCLVQIIQSVNDTHDGYQMPINLPEQAPSRGFVKLYDFSLKAGEGVHSLVGIISVGMLVHPPYTSRLGIVLEVGGCPWVFEVGLKDGVLITWCSHGCSKGGLLFGYRSM